MNLMPELFWNQGLEISYKIILIVCKIIIVDDQEHFQIQILERTPIPKPNIPASSKLPIELPGSLNPSKFYFLLLALIVLFISSISALREA